MNDLIITITNWLTSPHSVTFDGWVWLLFGGGLVVAIIIGWIIFFFAERSACIFR